MKSRVGSFVEFVGVRGVYCSVVCVLLCLVAVRRRFTFLLIFFFGVFISGGRGDIFIGGVGNGRFFFCFVIFGFLDSKVLFLVIDIFGN